MAHSIVEQTVELVFVKETKPEKGSKAGALQYQEVDEDGKQKRMSDADCIVYSMYLRKLGIDPEESGDWPDGLTITITPTWKKKGKQTDVRSRRVRDDDDDDDRRGGRGRGDDDDALPTSEDDDADEAPVPERRRTERLGRRQPVRR